MVISGSGLLETTAMYHELPENSIQSSTQNDIRKAENRFSARRKRRRENPHAMIVARAPDDEFIYENIQRHDDTTVFKIYNTVVQTRGE